MHESFLEDRDQFYIGSENDGYNSDPSYKYPSHTSAMVKMYQVLLSQKEKGKLIVIASHSNEDIAALCNEIFRFDKRKIVGHEVVSRQGQVP